MAEENLPIDSHFVKSKLALAHAFVSGGDPVQACSVLEELIEHAPSNRDAHQMLVHVLILLGRWERFGEAMNLLIGLGDSPVAHEAHDRALLALRLGRFREGWMLYESRWQCAGLTGPELDFKQPRWDGSPFKGKTLLVYYEQGLGDTFMFVRYAPQIKALGGRVLFAVQPALADVVATCSGVDGVVLHGKPLPPFDLYVRMLSLPWILQTDVVNIPAEIPYLDVPKRVPNRERIMGLLSTPEGRIRIGLVWAGSPTHKRDAERSIPPEVLAPLAALRGVSWYSFQLEAKSNPPLPGLISLDSSLRNFSDTAYALSGMHLVITVDTALAHLAGALGIPTLLLVAFFPDFRWMMGRDDSPWYPSMRIYRQLHFGDWESVILRVLADLSAPA
jgi:hypothetical protein